jgi:hypothetical protein
MENTQNALDSAAQAALMSRLPKKPENIYSKLQKARVMLRNIRLEKSGFNSHLKYHYYELEDILPAIDDILEEVKMYIALDLENDRAILTVINTENLDERLTFLTPTIPPDKCSKMQDLGAIGTYAHRYALIRAFHITEPCTIDANVGRIDQSVNAKKTTESIDSIESISELNNTFRFLTGNPNKFPKNTWAASLWEKAKTLGASYDEKDSIFVCSQKSNAVAAMIS